MRVGGMAGTRRWLGLALGLSVAVGCGGDDPAGPGRVPTSLVKVTGDSQQVTVGTVAALPLVVEVTDARGTPVSGVLVSFTVDSSSGFLTPNAVTTGPDGRAASQWRIPTLLGSYTARVSAAGVDSAVFTSKAIAAGVATLELVQGDSQAALVGTALDTTIVIRLKDGFGNPASGRSVTHAVISGGGRVSPDTAVTDPEGLATFIWTIGPRKGYDTLAIRHDSLERRIGAIALPPLIPDSLALGNTHTCALDNAGRAWCFGLNYQGEVGKGDTTSAFTPTQVSGAPAFAAIAAGAYHSCGLTAASELYCWGTALSLLGLDATRQDFGLTFEQVTAGAPFTCGVTSTGTGYCWGGNAVGQLGDGSTTDRPVPTPISGGLHWRQLAAQGGRVCGLATNGRAFCWGGTSTSPRAVAVNIPFSTIATTEAGGCGLTIDGEAWCWGLSTAPAALPSLRWASLTGGTSGFCGVTVGGQGACWGENGSGQNGDGTTAPSATPVMVSGGHTFSEIRQSDGHSCGRTAAGGLFCWGRGAR